MAPPKDGQTEQARTPKRGRRQVRERPEAPPEGETLDSLLDGAARACREHGRGELAQVLERRRKRDGE